MTDTTSPSRSYALETPFHLRSLKIHKGLSEETLCFEARIFWGDLEIAHVSNRGQGGCHEIHYPDRTLGAEFEKYAKNMPEAEFPAEWGGGTYERGVDGLVDLLVSEAEALKNAKKWLTFVDSKTGIERGFLELKRGRKKVPASDVETRDRTLAENPDFLWVDPNAVR